MTISLDRLRRQPGATSPKRGVSLRSLFQSKIVSKRSGALKFVFEMIEVFRGLCHEDRPTFCLLVPLRFVLLKRNNVEGQHPHPTTPAVQTPSESQNSLKLEKSPNEVQLPKTDISKLYKPNLKIITCHLWTHQSLTSRAPLSAQNAWSRSAALIAE